MAAIPSFTNQATGFGVTFSGSGAANNPIVVTGDVTRSIVVRGWLCGRTDANSGVLNYSWRDSDGNILYGPFPVLAQGQGYGMGSSGNEDGWFFAPPGKNLLLYSDVAGGVSGGVTWFYR